MLLIIALIIGFIAGKFTDFSEQCPRRIQQWSCKGRDCDHSRLAVLLAKVEMEKNNV